jgi:hypothetical protein
MRLLKHWLAHLPASWMGISEAERTYRINRTMSHKKWLKQYEKASKKNEVPG